MIRDSISNNKYFILSFYLGNENYVTNSLLFFEYFEKFKNLYYQLNFQINENIHLYIILQVIEKQLFHFR